MNEIIKYVALLLFLVISILAMNIRNHLIEETVKPINTNDLYQHRNKYIR